MTKVYNTVDDIDLDNYDNFEQFIVHASSLERINTFAVQNLWSSMTGLMERKVSAKQRKKLIGFCMFVATQDTSYKYTREQYRFLCRVVEHLSKNPEKIMMLSYADEAPLMEDSLTQIYEVCERYDVAIERVFMVGNDFMAQETINDFCRRHEKLPIRYITYWNMVGHLGQVVKEGFEIDFDTKRDVNVVTYNRRFGPERASLLHELWQRGCHKKSLHWSAFPPQRPGEIVSANNFVHTQKAWSTWTFLENENKFELFKKDMKFGECVDDGKGFIVTIDEMGRLPRTSYQWVVTESTAELSHAMFLTEKTLKPFFTGQGFLVYNTPGTVKVIKDLGFVDLSQFSVDHSYDTELNPKRRMSKLADEIDKIASLSEDEAFSLWQKSSEEILHNKNRFNKLKSELFFENCDDRFIREVFDPMDRKEVMNRTMQDEVELIKFDLDNS